MNKFTRALTATLITACLASAGPAFGAQGAGAKDNGVGQTPVLGWSSWSFLREHPTAAKIEAQALALHESGLQDLGYEYINLDDFWYECPGAQGPNVGPYGHWVTNPAAFPPNGATNGIKSVADYVHNLGMKFGIYLTPGISKQAVVRDTPIKGTAYTAAQIAEPSIAETNYNCKGMVAIDYGKPGAQEYINSWVDLLATWGVDFIKIDGMGNSNAPDVKAWSKAIEQSGRPMVLDITQGSFTDALAPTLMKYAQQWEFAPDIECYDCEKNGSSYPLTSWANAANRFDYVAQWQPYAGPGGFNDYDSIEVGNGSRNGLTPAERQTQMSLWALGASPFILGIDLTHIDQHDLQAYLKNTAILEVDQDAIAAKRLVNSVNEQVFAKIEANGDAIVGLFNTGNKAAEVSVSTLSVGISKGRHGYSQKDLWTGNTKTIDSVISATVPSHGVALYRIKTL